MNFVLKKITAIILCFSFIFSIVSISYNLGSSSKYLSKEVLDAKQSLKKADNSKNNNLEELENETFANLAGSFSLSFDLVSQKHGSELIPPLGFLSSPPFSPPNA